MELYGRETRRVIVAIGLTVATFGMAKADVDTIITQGDRPPPIPWTRFTLSISGGHRSILVEWQTPVVSATDPPLTGYEFKYCKFNGTHCNTDQEICITQDFDADNRGNNFRYTTMDPNDRPCSASLAAKNAHGTGTRSRVVLRNSYVPGRVRNFQIDHETSAYCDVSWRHPDRGYAAQYFVEYVYFDERNELRNQTWNLPRTQTSLRVPIGTNHDPWFVSVRAEEFNHLGPFESINIQRVNHHIQQS